MKITNIVRIGLLLLIFFFAVGCYPNDKYADWNFDGKYKLGRIGGGGGPREGGDKIPPVR